MLCLSSRLLQWVPYWFSTKSQTISELSSVLSAVVSASLCRAEAHIHFLSCWTVGGWQSDLFRPRSRHLLRDCLIRRGETPDPWSLRQDNSENSSNSPRTGRGLCCDCTEGKPPSTILLPSLPHIHPNSGHSPINFLYEKSPFRIWFCKEPKLKQATNPQDRIIFSSIVHSLHSFIHYWQSSSNVPDTVLTFGNYKVNENCVLPSKSS